MKNVIVFFVFLITSVFLFGQEAVPIDSAVVDSSKIEIPHPLCVIIENEEVCFPTNDAKEAAEIIARFVNQNKTDWPKNVWGVIVLIVGFLFSAPGTALISNATKVYAFLKTFLRRTLHVVAFIAGLFAVGVSFAVGAISGKGFSWQLFSVVWPSVSFVAVYVYETWIKKEDEDVPDNVG